MDKGAGSQPLWALSMLAEKQNECNSRSLHKRHYRAKQDRLLIAHASNSTAHTAGEGEGV